MSKTIWTLGLLLLISVPILVCSNASAQGFFIGETYIPMDPQQRPVNAFSRPPEGPMSPGTGNTTVETMGTNEGALGSTMMMTSQTEESGFIPTTAFLKRKVQGKPSALQGAPGAASASPAPHTLSVTPAGPDNARVRDIRKNHDYDAERDEDMMEQSNIGSVIMKE